MWTQDILEAVEAFRNRFPSALVDKITPALGLPMIVMHLSNGEKWAYNYNTKNLFKAW